MCGKWAASLQDVRAKRGADIVSDHKLVVAKVKLRLKCSPKTEVRKKLDIDIWKRREIMESSE